MQLKQLPKNVMNESAKKCYKCDCNKMQLIQLPKNVINATAIKAIKQEMQ